ncbi:hypothetical protein AB0F77_39570 [Streptomyces sp. NPDC026672]|uniref:hypothetical protein n=1 Tax=Actinomycetes TaxID=1760 RepID=UPI0033D10A50
MVRPRTVDEERASIHMDLGRMYEGYDELSELLDDLLRAHAHELAEKIRAHTWSAGCTGVGCCADTPDMAADLIDPEVS